MSASAGTADERLLATFLDLVRIYSPSTKEAECAHYCAAALTEAGCSVRFDDAGPATGSDIGNLIAELPGTAPGVLVLSAHMDCVEPCDGVRPVVCDGIIASSGTTILGADDKAGLAAAIECVRRLSEGDTPYPTVRCVFTVQEEVGLLGAKNLDPAAAEGDLCLVLDAEGGVGAIVTGAPTHYTFTAEFTGTASHAGVRPEAGISAIRMAAVATERLPIGRIDEQTTANVGTVHGGTATNVIAARCTLTGECRSLDRATVESLRASMDETMRACAAEAGGTVDITWTLEYEGFRFSNDDPAIAIVARACDELGIVASHYETGGGSDANIFAAHGSPVVALACGMRGVHGVDEELAVSDLEGLAALCTAVASRLADR
jgi:tripeptide aminopeptidase